MTRRLLIAGVGNIFLGDDGFGVEVARRLADADLPDWAHVVDYGIRGMHLAYDLANGYESMILVDTTARGGSPGTIYVIEPDLAAIPEEGMAAADQPGYPLFNAHGMQPDVVFSMLGMLDAGSDIDVCFTAAETQCYSPDNPSTFFYCGYHGSVDFQDIGHVLYSVEPYDNVLGCSVYPNSPNGQLVDSQDNVLSHESFETITDPDGTAWINFSQVIMLGAEIGDECEFVTFLGPNQTPYFNPPAFKIDGHKYAVQSEYSNDVHGCGTAP